MNFGKFRERILSCSQSADIEEFSKLVAEYPEFAARWKDLRHTKSGDTFAHQAAMSGCVEILRYCSEACPGILKQENSDKKVPLHVAAQFEQVKCAHFLLSSGASVDPLKRADWTPLMLACTKNDLQMIELLLDSGAQPMLTNKDGWTCFHIACREGNDEIVCYLLDEHPLLWRTKSNNRRTPLHTAALHGMLNTVRILLSRGNYNPDDKDACGTTPLMDAATANSIPIMKLLIEEHKASPYTFDVLGRNSLHCALQAQAAEAVTYLKSNFNGIDKMCCQRPLQLIAKIGFSV